MSDFLNQFRKENYQHKNEGNSYETAPQNERSDTAIENDNLEREKTEDEKIAEILMALNVSEAIDEIDEEDEAVHNIIERMDETIHSADESLGEYSESEVEANTHSESDYSDSHEDSENYYYEPEETGEYVYDSYGVYEDDPTDSSKDYDDAYEDDPTPSQVDYDDLEEVGIGNALAFGNNLSAAERAMRERENTSLQHFNSFNDTEAFSAREVNRRNRVPSRNTRIPSVDHQVVRDTKHHKRQMFRIFFTSFIILAIVAAGFFFHWNNNQVEVPNFVGTPVSAARNWELTNRITFEVNHVHSLEYDDGIIMVQESAPGTRIRSGGVFRITVSLGPNPDEHITLPHFETMTIAQIREWSSQYRMRNITIREEYSDTLEAGRFIRMEFVGQGVTRENFRRQDVLNIYMSRGEEVFPANIPVPNFIGRTLPDVEEWAGPHDITVHYIESVSSTIAVGMIISQSIGARELVARESEITITISLGAAVIVPNFATMSMEEAVAYPDLRVISRRRFHGTVPYGHLIYQSEEPGTELIGDNVEVVVYYSLGRPFIENLIGRSENVIPSTFYSFTSQGANITYNIIYIDSHLPRGQITDMSRFNEWLAMEDHVNIWVSRGNLPPPEPDPPADPPPTP